MAVSGCVFVWMVFIEPDSASFSDRVVTALVLGLLVALFDTVDYRWLRVVASQGPAMTTAVTSSKSTAKLWVANFALVVGTFVMGFSLSALNGMWLPVSMAIFATGLIGSRRIHRRLESQRAVAA